MKILFVCLGNICRSPAAEGICRLYHPSHDVASAGTSGYHTWNGPDLKSVAICQHNNIDISGHVAQAIVDEDAEIYDLIYATDKATYYKLREIIGDRYHEKIHMLGKEDIIDPYGLDMSVFEKMYKQLEEAILQLKI